MLRFFRFIVLLLIIVSHIIIIKGCGDSSSTPITKPSITINSIRNIYELDTIKKMSMEDLQWKETKREVLEDGTLLIEGSFIGGPWETISKADLENANIDNTVTVQWTHPVKLFIPAAYPGLPTLGFGASVEVQTMERLNDPEWIARFWVAAIEEGIPILIHSNDDNLWLNLGYASNTELAGAAFELVRLKNSATIENLRLTLMYPYTRADLMAITLMSRLLENEGGHLDKGVIASGSSKQGNAHWLLGIIDDRVKVLVPSDFQLEDYVTGAARYETDLNCENNPACDEGFSLEDRLQLRKWILTTNAGELFNNVYDVAVQQDLLFPRFIVISGDVTSPGHHDCQFPLGADSEFLKGLKTEWRGYRTSSDQYWTTRLDPMSAHMWKGAIRELTQPESADWVNVTNVLTESISSTRLKIIAELTNNHSDSVVKLWYAPSTNRAWNDDEQTGSWNFVTMKPDNGKWSITVDVSLDKEWAYYVEVDDVAEDGLTRIDVSPVEFFNEFPPLQCLLP